MDRIHRLGQKRPVKVVKLVVEDSIEDQIVQLQAKKLAMTDAALSRDPDAALGKLTVEDVSATEVVLTTAWFPFQVVELRVVLVVVSHGPYATRLLVDSRCPVRIQD